MQNRETFLKVLRLFGYFSIMGAVLTGCVLIYHFLVGVEVRSGANSEAIFWVTLFSDLFYFVLSLMGTALWFGAANLVDSIWETQDKVATIALNVSEVGGSLNRINKKLESFFGEEEESDMSTLKKLVDANHKLDELNEGFATILEEVIKRVDSISEKIDQSRPK